MISHIPIRSSHSLQTEQKTSSINNRSVNHSTTCLETDWEQLQEDMFRILLYTGTGIISLGGILILLGGGIGGVLVAGIGVIVLALQTLITPLLSTLKHNSAQSSELFKAQPRPKPPQDSSIGNRISHKPS